MAVICALLEGKGESVAAFNVLVEGLNKSSGQLPFFLSDICG
jgi:hypothetical protein